MNTITDKLIIDQFNELNPGEDYTEYGCSNILTEDGLVNGILPDDIEPCDVVYVHARTDSIDAICPAIKAVNSFIINYDGNVKEVLEIECRVLAVAIKDRLPTTKQEIYELDPQEMYVDKGGAPVIRLQDHHICRFWIDDIKSGKVKFHVRDTLAFPVCRKITPLIKGND